MTENKFKFIVIDDRNAIDGAVGWQGSIFMMQELGYIERRDEIDEYDNSLAMSYKVLNPLTGYDFDKATKYLDRNKDSYDFYLIDLWLNEVGFRPTTGYTDKIRNLDEYVDEAKKPEFVAGLEFIKYLEKNRKPKIFYTAFDTPRKLIRYLNLIKSRWDDILLTELTKKTYNAEFEKHLDKYLRQRQVEIIYSQPIDFRKELKDRLDKPDSWSKYDILDDKEEESYWSLRTLFPKQINRMESGEDPDSMKQYIENILDLDWRRLISDGREGLLVHPTKERLEYFLKGVEDLDFEEITAKATGLYKRFTDLKHFTTNIQDLRNLRDFILTAKTTNKEIEQDYYINCEPTATAAKDKADYTGQSLIDYFQELLLDYTWDEIFSGCVEICREYGIYPFDIAYISHIAFHNERHNARPKFCIKKKGETIQFIWSYPESAEEVFKEDLTLYRKLSSDSNQEPKRLSDCGYADICKIICWRYNGTVEFSSGTKSFIARRVSRVTVESRTSPILIPGAILIITIGRPEVL